MKALLGVHSYFSFHWGTASPADWFARAADLGFTHIGFTDQAALTSMPAIVSLAETSPLQPVYGASFPFADGGAVFMFPENARGYGNLCQRITAWQAALPKTPDPMAGGAPILPAAVGHRLCGGTDFVGGLVAVTDDADAWRLLHEAGVETYWRIGPTLAAPPAFAPREKWLFVPGLHMLEAGEFDTHRLLRAIGGATTLDRIPEADRVGLAPPPLCMARPDDWLRPPGEYDALFAPYRDAIDRTDALATRLARFRPNRDIITPPDPPTSATGCWSESPMARLRRLAYEGAAVRYPVIDEAIRERLERELELIHRKCFAEYFLVVHDIVARLAGGDGRVRPGRSITCGRGSGAASLVNYCLGVTNVDVMKHDLMFERFLNNARKDPPDIDVDFAWDERDDLLERVLAEYGSDRVGRVANHNRYDWRGAFRAASRTLGFSDAEITRHLRESPSAFAADRPGDCGPSPESDTVTLPTVTDRATKRLGLLRRSGQSDWNRAERLSRRIIDFPRCLSMHCGGVVISSGVLARSVPVVRSAKGYPTIQWEKDGAEIMGLVKIDLLGNRSLAVIRDAVHAVSRDTGIPPELVIRGDPTDDPATKALLERGDTFGVFYLESPSMRLLMAKARVGDFAHAVVHSSIIRPAANAFINEYIRRLHNMQKGIRWQESDPILDGLFEESYGIPVYQEDVIRLAARLAGYDYAQADQLRKALGKRDAKERLAELFPAVRTAAYAKGIKKETVDIFWHTLMSMTGYSFCKPHSASYAQVSFEAAYLRAHYPAYFIAAVLSNGGGYYTSQSYVSEAMRLGLDVRGPDVNRSAWDWRAEGPGAVRTGFMAISGMSRAGADAIIAAREERPFSGLRDFFERMRLDSDDMRRLAITGALDSLAPEWNRPQLMWCAVKAAVNPKATRAATTLFDRTPAAAGPVFDAMQPPDLPPHTPEQRMEAAYSLLGFIPGRHPLYLYKDEIRAEAARLATRSRPILTTAAHIGDHVGKVVTLVVWPVAAKIVQTKHGNAMMFQSFEDTRSLVETVIFPEEFAKYHRLLATLQPLWITGTVLNEFDVPTVRILSVRPARSRRREAVEVPAMSYPAMIG